MMRRQLFRMTLVLLAVVGWPRWQGSPVMLAQQAADKQAARESFQQANSLLAENRFAEAVAAYDRAIQQDAQFAEAYHNRAVASEMVDRLKALQDWKRFAELGASNPDLKWDVARAQARVQILEKLPQYPEALHPTRYVSNAGDYYWQIANRSETERWTAFPLRVFLGSAPEIKWQAGAREAFDIWKGMFPLELVAMPEQADIRMAWEDSELGRGHAGEELDWVQVKRVGDEATGRKVAFIRVDMSRRWSKDEMRAIVLHEMGHSLGIKDHSDSPKDIMFWRMQESSRQIPVPGFPLPIFWKSLVSKPSQRDLNTLIRLYNTAGPVTIFK